MDIISTSLEALIQRATNVNNQGPDTAAIDAFCGLINKEPESAPIAAKFITAKVHSLQEWEALQALLVLETCMKRCGSAFHSEVGKFRFLNELIKLISPKYMGAHTPEPVRRRVLELMYSWTIQYPRETKIKEAYDMLKKQGVVKEESQLSIRCDRQWREQPSILQDEEKSQLLQRLLQSKNPDDLQAANRLIKSMVKEDERRVEEKWRHAAEVETAQNNCQLLKEMILNWEPRTGRTEDLELMKELHSACLRLRPSLQRLPDNPTLESDFIQRVITANEELEEVLDKYDDLLRRVPLSLSTTAGPDPRQTEPSGTSLLDLTPSPSRSTVSLPSSQPQLASSLAELCLESSDVVKNSEEKVHKAPVTGAGTMGDSDLLNDLFGPAPPLTSQPPPPHPPSVIPQIPLLQPTSGSLSLTSTSIFSDKSIASSKDGSKSKGLEELDLLSKSLLQENLLLSKAAQNNKPVKVSLNDMNASLVPKTGRGSASDVSLLEESELLDCSAGSPNGGRDELSPPLPVVEPELHPEPSPVVLTSGGGDLGGTVPNVRDSAPPPPSPNTSLPAPLGEIKVTLETVKPSTLPPFTALEERNGISVSIFLAKDHPRPDVSVFVVTTSSKNQSPIQNFLFQPVVPKCCRLRLLPPSSTTLPAHNPFLPPSAITQIMLIAAPNRDPIAFKFVVSYMMEEETFTELGDITSLPLMDT